MSNSSSFVDVDSHSSSGLEDATSALSISTNSRASSIEPTPLTRANLNAHTMAATEPSVRRQFVCPDHGAFWKKVPPQGNKRDGTCVATCKKCPVINGARQKFVAIPIDQERGKGLFRCGECANIWTSNTACRSLAQYCWAEDCTARDRMHGEYPAEVRAPDPGWLRARRFAQRQQDTPTIDENAPVNFEEANYFPPAGDGGAGDWNAADAGSTQSERSARSIRSDGFGGPDAPGGTRGAARRRRPHHCSGCATGACKQPPPPSRPHESSGSTAATMSGRTWSTANSEWSVGSVHTERSPAPESRSRRRMFIGGGRVSESVPVS